MKKTEFISFRTDLATKETLTKIAADKKWSISLLVEDIVQEWIEQNVSSDLHEVVQPDDM